MQEVARIAALPTTPEQPETAYVLSKGIRKPGRQLDLYRRASD